MNDDTNKKTSTPKKVTSHHNIALDISPSLTPIFCCKDSSTFEPMVDQSDVSRSMKLGADEDSLGADKENVKEDILVTTKEKEEDNISSGNNMKANNYAGDDNDDDRRIQQIADASKKAVENHKERTWNAFIFYFIALIVFGLPLWWYTTSPYRASLESFNQYEAVPLKINIISSSKDTYDFQRMIENSMLASLLPGPIDGERFWEVQMLADYSQTKDYNGDLGNIFQAKIVVLSNSDFTAISKSSQCDVFVLPDSTILIRNDVSTSLAENFDNFMTHDWLGINRIYSMIARVKSMEESITDVTPNVWNDVSISAAYNLHVIFVYENMDCGRWDSVEASIMDEINRMVNYLSDAAFFSITIEHFWDLLDFETFKSLKKEKLVFEAGDMSKFITTIDEYSSPVVSSAPLFKFVFVLTENGILIDGKESNGQTFASWGSIINVSPNNDTAYLNSIYESFHVLFGAEQTFSSSKFCSSSPTQPNHFAWNRYRRHAYLENLLKSKHFITAINNLASKIPQLIITKEVGELVRKSKSFMEEAIEEQNPLKAAVTRLLAERAVDHGSLIGQGDLPFNLKAGLYVVISMGLLMPLIDVLKPYGRNLFERLRKFRLVKSD